MLKSWKIQGQFLSVVSSLGWTSDLTGSLRHSSVSEAGPLGRASGQHAVLRACEKPGSRAQPSDPHVLGLLPGLLPSQGLPGCLCLTHAKKRCPEWLWDTLVS